MTRENLLQAIYDNADEWSCAYSCQYDMKEENPKIVCMDCANKLLKEYEQQIRADAIEEFVGNTIEEIENIKKWYEEQYKEIYDVQICIVLEDLNNLINGLKEQSN